MCWISSIIDYFSETFIDSVGENICKISVLDMSNLYFSLLEKAFGESGATYSQAHKEEFFKEASDKHEVRNSLTSKTAEL